LTLNFSDISFKYSYPTVKFCIRTARPYWPTRSPGSPGP